MNAFFRTIFILGIVLYSFAVSDLNAKEASAPSFSASRGAYVGRIELSWATDTAHPYVKIWRSLENESVAVAVYGWGSDTLYMDKHVEEGVVYRYWIQAAVNIQGDSPTRRSPPVNGWSQIELSPIAPTFVHASRGVFYSQIRLSWLPPTENPRAFFQLSRSEKREGPFRPIHKKWTPDFLFTDEGLPVGKVYFYRLQAAEDLKGRHPGPFSKVIEAYTGDEPKIPFQVWTGTLSPLLSIDSVGFDPAGGERLPFERKPKMYGKYYPIGSSKVRRVGLKTVTRFPSKMTTNAIQVEATPKVLLYDAASLKRWLSDSAKGGVDSFIADQQSDSVTLTLFGKTTIQKQKIDARFFVDFQFLPPLIDSALDTALSIGTAETFILTGRAFGSRPPKVWIEYPKNGKMRKLSLKVLKPYAYENAFERPESACTDPVSGISRITVATPKKWPVDWIHGSYSLVIDSGCGLAVRKIITSP